MSQPDSPADTQARQGSDKARYAEKFSCYVPAVDAISSALASIRELGTMHGTGISGILAGTLPRLRNAFSSEVAFLGDTRLKVRASDPPSLGLTGEILPLAKEVLDLVQPGSSLVLDQDTITVDHPLLGELGFRSLLIACLPLADHRFYIGVANSSREEGYLLEDSRLLNSLLRILEFGLRYGHTQAESSAACRRYRVTRAQGEYTSLSGASAELARLLGLSLGETRAAHDHDIHLDDVLADYLDAELSIAMLALAPSSGNETQVDGGKGAQQADRAQGLLDLIRLTDSANRAEIRLRGKHGRQLEIDLGSYPRTALAVNRVFLWAGFVRAGFRVPEGYAEAKRSTKHSKQKPGSLGAALLFGPIADSLLANAGPFTDDSRDLGNEHAQIDWLRSRWQKIHYLTMHGTLEPKRERLKEAKALYWEVQHWTVRTVHDFLMARQTPQTLQIDSDWLIAWLVTSALLSEGLARYHGLGAETPSEVRCSPAETMRYMACLSETALYALHCARHHLRKAAMPAKLRTGFRRPDFADVPAYLSPGRTEAQLFVLCEYAYREINVPRELNLFERLTRQLRFELSLYAAGGFYRDHLYHVVDVCLLGELLLRSAVPTPPGEAGAQSLADVLCEAIKGHALQSLHSVDNDVTPQPEELLRNWYVAALWHDLGYVVEKASALIRPVAQIDGPGLNQFHAAVQQGLDQGESEIMQAAENRLSASPHPRLDKDTIVGTRPTDHGLVAWLHLYSWLDAVQQPPSLLAHAMTAILRHNLPAQKVNLCREPLTLLLILCDHLQEWGRPRVQPDPLARSVMEALRSSEQPHFGEKVCTRQLTVKGLQVIPMAEEPDGETDSISRVQTQLGETAEFHIQYVEAREGDFEPVVSWLMLCRDLQCFASRRAEFPLRLIIQLEHTPSQIWHLLPWKPLEMDLLQEFASQYEPAAYLLEWIRSARGGKEGIEYKGDHDAGEESFRIDLKELNEPLKRGLEDDLWKEFIKWKWRQLGQRYAKLNLGYWFPDL